MYSPSASLPPGHFCTAELPSKVAGQVIFQISSCSREHPILIPIHFYIHIMLATLLDAVV